MNYFKKRLMAFSVSLALLFSATAMVSAECPPTKPDCGGDVWLQNK